jgi:hypothetical protein
VLAIGLELAPIFRMACQVRPERLDVAFARDRMRNQYYSTAILQAMQPLVEPGARLLAVTSVDLYVPVLTFVFGEAQLTGSCAVVSLHRLREEFYGLPAREELMRERLVKEAVHELGHTFRPAALRRLALCDDVQPRRGAAGREGCGFLRSVRAGGGWGARGGDGVYMGTRRSASATSVVRPKSRRVLRQPCGAANPGRSRLFRRLDPLESGSAG